MNRETFIRLHKNQLESSGVPERFWNSVYEKLAGNVFDAGSAFSLLQVQDEDGDFVGWKAVVIKEGGIKADASENVFLVDHAWTFRPQSAKKMLRQNPNLLTRMINLMDMGHLEEDESTSLEDKIDQVMKASWKYSQTYWIGNREYAEDRVPVWYVLDEFGSRIPDLEYNYETGEIETEANIRIVPFISSIDGAGYSLLFPTKDIDENEDVIRDYLEGPEARDPLCKRALRNIWADVDMTEIVSWKQHEPNESFFKSGRTQESLPDPEMKPLPLPTDRKIRVYTEYPVITANLKHERFEIVDNLADADVLWLVTHFKEFKEFAEEFPGKRINQFPHENVVTTKDLLAIVGRRRLEGDEKDRRTEDDNLGDDPKWLPKTFNLGFELEKFVAFYQEREKLGLDNYWIVKPWNLARSLDTHISNDLSELLKLHFSGPKIAQKYLEKPILFRRPEVGDVKFDVRYILLLRSVSPLKLFVYDRFWLRFANKSFDLSEFDIYEKHFTVMNYNDSDLKQMFCHDFIKEFDVQNPDFKWKEKTEPAIFDMLRSVFKAAASKPPPCGLAASPQSGSMFAVDLMLTKEQDEIVPKILEINWCPDCERACDYYPEYFDDVFSVLFLDQVEGKNVTRLL